MANVQKIKKVALLLDTSTGWGRNIIRGIDRFARETGNWDLEVQPHMHADYMPLPPRWKGDGIIARVAGKKMAMELAGTGLPVVNVSSLPLPGAVFPRVITDFKAAGQLSADHLIARGFLNFAYCQPARSPQPSICLMEGYSESLREKGFSCQVFDMPGSRVSLERRQELILKWLCMQDFPLAVLGWSIDAPREIIGACRYGKIHVPEEVAVVSSASMDELILQVTRPSISCVVTPEMSIGYAAAKLLENMMQRKGSVQAGRTILIGPSHVEVRESSDVLAVHDPGLVKALRYIRAGAVTGISVEDVAQHAGLSRRSLEQKMKQLLQRSPAEEIRLIRLNQAKLLLQTTMLSIPDVAARSGFGTVEHFITFFKKSAGVTPLQYAKKNRML